MRVRLVGWCMVLVACASHLTPLRRPPSVPIPPSPAPPTARGPVAVAALIRPSPARDVWACIRWFESRNNYADRDNPTHFGAYQFLISTWESVGGRGNPADASPAEQDTRARMLERRSGWGQWSTHRLCGV